MSEEHLHPDRGWSLVREGGQFTPEEIDHLQDCAQCSEWVALFAELAHEAGYTPTSSKPYFVAVDEHLTAERGWALIRDRGQLAPPELAHLHYCKICNEWLTLFASIARKAGFKIAFEIPPCDAA